VSYAQELGQPKSTLPQTSNRMDAMTLAADRCGGGQLRRLLSPRAAVASARHNPECRVDLIAERHAAWVGVGLGGVVAIHHVRVADPVLEVDETE